MDEIQQIAPNNEQVAQVGQRQDRLEAIMINVQEVTNVINVNMLNVTNIMQNFMQQHSGTICQLSS